jgi:hypothetical protein
MFEYKTVYGILKSPKELHADDIIKIRLRFSIYKADVHFRVKAVIDGVYVDLIEHEIIECEIKD